MLRAFLKINILFVVLLSAALIVTGCEQKTEKPAEETGEEISETPSIGEEPADTMSQEPAEETVMDVTGRWTGTFDSRAATLNITSQDGNNFSGSMTVAYKDPLTKALTGEFNMESMAFTMTDTQQGRFKGKYNGTLGNDGKMSGSFTLNSDGSSYNFNLTKR